MITGLRIRAPAGGSGPQGSDDGDHHLPDFLGRSDAHPMATPLNPRHPHGPPPRPAGAPPNVVAILLGGKRNLYTWVDPDIAAKYAHYRWRLRDSRGYVSVSVGGKLVGLHRLVRRVAPGRWVHHRDGCPLHNWKANLTRCTPAQNSHVRRKRAGRSSHFFGVWWNAEKRRWCAEIVVNGRRYRLGRFATQVAAARAWDAAVRELRSAQFWTLNFPE